MTTGILITIIFVTVFGMIIASCSFDTIEDIIDLIKDLINAKRIYAQIIFLILLNLIMVYPTSSALNWIVRANEEERTSQENAKNKWQYNMTSNGCKVTSYLYTRRRIQDIPIWTCPNGWAYEEPDKY